MTQSGTSFLEQAMTMITRSVLRFI